MRRQPRHLQRRHKGKRVPAQAPAAYMKKEKNLYDKKFEPVKENIEKRGQV